MDIMQTERAKYWKEQVESWQSSGVKMRALRKANEISEKSLSRWKKKLADEIELNRGFDHTLLREVVEALTR